ncbi:ABC transporter substrate-binding protein [Nocardioides sp.]|uniref:heme/hemin ABC transporter substrate-binding protein n=1 Tax=Nocardioides sp. TaxID=35761 RepID=UPI001A210A1F|nr:ABC transporter substrate-binding protein [Nocardioides sp.]MBJ7355766.1 ABC transporter substrate-binding protein [Nocardioides sp.]
MNRLVLAALLVVTLTTGCGLEGPSAATPEGGDPDRPAAVSLAEATPLADPRDWTGPSTAVLPDTPVDPVAVGDQRLPVTVTDAQGTRVTVTDTSRILALDVHGTLARTVFELGLGQHVVGRDISTQFAEAADLPLVTPVGHDLAAEAILELDPTVILTDTSLGPWDVVLQMRDAGIPVVVTDSHRGLDNLGSLTEEVAAALGVEEAGRMLAERIETEVAEVRAQVEAVAPTDPGDRLRTVFLYVRGQSGVYYLFGNGSGADQLIEGVGGYDVAEEIGWKGMRPVTDEGIVAAAPELVLLMTKGLESAGGVDGLLERLPALATTPAGQNRRFVDMDDAQVLGFGPTTAAVLDALAVAIYAPEAVS